MFGILIKRDYQRHWHEFQQQSVAALAVEKLGSRWRTQGFHSRCGTGQYYSLDGKSWNTAATYDVGKCHFSK